MLDLNIDGDAALACLGTKSDVVAIAHTFTGVLEVVCNDVGSGMLAVARESCDVSDVGDGCVGARAGLLDGILTHAGSGAEEVLSNEVISKAAVANLLE